MSTTRPHRPLEPAPIRFMTLRELRREETRDRGERRAVRRPPRLVLRTVRA